jgi:hypothetical protein
MSDLKDKILALRLDGLSYRQIQSELNCSKGTIAYYLGEGQKEKNLQRQQVKRNAARQYIRSVKEGQPCADCGIVYPPYVLQFDHIGSDKSFTITEFATTTIDLEKIKAEIAKCEIVCANCHAERTWGSGRTK